ncbi:hypothetical protein [Kineococcus sp. SYSU DK005]|uniref:hypothetical protein n=1 Tax=Kineococcus sp. SYSU DK005 TaxID=3383126 RepID=UPI003D7DA051
MRGGDRAVRTIPLAAPAVAVLAAVLLLSSPQGPGVVRWLLAALVPASGLAGALAALAALTSLDRRGEPGAAGSRRRDLLLLALSVDGLIALGSVPALWGIAVLVGGP